MPVKVNNTKVGVVGIDIPVSSLIDSYDLTQEEIEGKFREIVISNPFLPTICDYCGGSIDCLPDSKALMVSSTQPRFYTGQTIEKTCCRNQRNISLSIMIGSIGLSVAILWSILFCWLKR